MDLACVDTHIVIWGIKEQASQGQEDMIRMAKGFLKLLDAKGTRVLVPSVVVAEILIPIPPELHRTVVNLFERSFMVGDFDLRASSHFARIWQTKQDAKMVGSLQAGGATKTELRADCMIVATAVAHGASCIYSHDRNLRKFAEGHIAAMEIPDVSEQLELFSN